MPPGTCSAALCFAKRLLFFMYPAKPLLLPPQAVCGGLPGSPKQLRLDTLPIPVTWIAHAVANCSLIGFDPVSLRRCGGIAHEQNVRADRVQIHSHDLVIAGELAGVKLKCWRPLL